MQRPDTLLKAEDNWTTSMGACFPGQGRVVFRGKDLFNDLGEMPWMGLLLYGITGRIFERNKIRLFEGVWTICTSYPDPRIWNNRVAALAGTTRSTATLALSAANSLSEASIYGRRPDIRSIDFFYRAQQSLDKGVDLLDIINSELKKYRVIPGYGRPIARKDERIQPLLNLAETLGYAQGLYVKLAFDVEKALLNNRRRLHMNIAALIAALAADQGLSRLEFYHYMVLCFTGGMLPCYIDAMNKAEGTFFPLRCERIAYEGVSNRTWPFPMG